MDVREAFAELGRLPLWDTPLTQVLQRVAELAAATVPGADQVSVTLVQGDRASSVAFTGDLAVHLDERQYAAGYGPCMEAALRGGTVTLFDLERGAQRYPDFAPAALRAGVSTVVSVGMPVPTRTVGGLNLYGLGRPGPGGPGGLDEGSVQVAETFAGYAAVAVANAGLLHSTTRLAEQMREAMATRAVIEQAKGILVARTGCSPEDAFALLSHRSQEGNRKLHDVAVRVVAEAQAGVRGQRGRPGPR